MAKAQDVKKASKAKAKKKWCPIIGPKSFDNVPLGESSVADAQQLLGKTVTVNLMHLTNDMRNQGIEIRFDVTKVQDGKGLASVVGYEVLPSQMKRVVRRGRSKVGDSFIVRVGKEQLVRIKPVAFTANRASRGAQTAIRLTMRERIKQLLSQTTFDDLIQDLVEYKIQRVLKESTGKHHPVKSVEIKACLLLPEKATERTPDVQETAEDKAEQAAEDVPESSEEPAEETAEEAAPHDPAAEESEAEPAIGEALEEDPQEK